MYAKFPKPRYSDFHFNDLRGTHATGFRYSDRRINDTPGVEVPTVSKSDTPTPEVSFYFPRFMVAKDTGPQLFD